MPFKIKISNTSPTDHILISLVNYNLYMSFVNLADFGFGYFRINEQLIDQINLFHDRRKNQGYGNTEGELLLIPEFYVLDSSYISIRSQDDNTDFDNIKSDSINFLKERPDLKNYMNKRCNGMLWIKPDNFIVCGEMMSHKDNFPMVIYRSRPLSYGNISHLLKRKVLI